ncbi:MAG: hypothetical protein R3C26_12430 [Calditrichia bacterium]
MIRWRRVNKVRTGPNRKVIIYERDEDTNLALKELLLNPGNC